MQAPPPEDTPVARVVQNVLRRTLRLKRGESVIIEAWSHMVHWSDAFVYEARRMGARPLVFFEDEETYWKSVETLPAKEIGKVGEAEWSALEGTDAYVFLWGPANRSRLQALPDDKRSALTAYNGEWYRRAEKAKIRACRIELGRATDFTARQYGVSGPVWREKLLEGSLVDPSVLTRDGRKVASKLAKGRSLTIRHANGTDLTLGLARRKPTIDDMVVDAEDVRAGNNVVSVPGGGVYVALDEKVASGTIVANRASYGFNSAQVGGRWEFAEGRLTSFAFERGGELFQEKYDAAPEKERDRPGFFSIGLNPKVYDAPNLEDVERGSVLVGVGANAGYGGKNSGPFSAWIGLAASHVEVDGAPIVADGEIL
jgi:leucyl aminopeptidase (aminopeptidase T)